MTDTSPPAAAGTAEGDGSGLRTERVDEDAGTGERRRRVLLPPVSRPGVLTAALFLALSLLPSMLPRTALLQGVVSSINIALGYGLGVFLAWLWRYLQIPRVRGRARTIVVGAWLALLAVIVALAVWRRIGFENEVREVFGVDPVSPTEWLVTVPVAVLVAALIVVVARLLWWLLEAIVGFLGRRLPGRLATVLGAVAVFLLLSGLWSGVIVNGFFAGANALFEPRDRATDEGVTETASSLRSGSPESLVSWDSLGRKGRSFVATGPTVEELEDFHDEEASEPIRVYVGLKSAPTLEGRAELALDELVRTGAFDRDVLVVATTTGTGFLEPEAVDALEFVHNGDTAIVGVQYSYLPSWISLLADQTEVEGTSKVVFDTIHRYWQELPEDARPEIHVYGLSLGSFGVEAVLRSIDMLNEPIDGALLVGPPFVNDLHGELTDDRDPGSTPETPVYENGRTVRFTNRESAVDLPSGEWGDTKVLYLQHASDPVVFFDTNLAVEVPEWLDPEMPPEERPDDLAEDFVWIPLVSFWQVLFDLPAAGSVPFGYGHMYSLAENAEAWVAVTEPDGWSDGRTAELLDHLDDYDVEP